MYIFSQQILIFIVHDTSQPTEVQLNKTNETVAHTKRPPQKCVC